MTLYILVLITISVHRPGRRLRHELEFIHRPGHRLRHNKQGDNELLRGMHRKRIDMIAKQAGRLWI